MDIDWDSDSYTVHLNRSSYQSTRIVEHLIEKMEPRREAAMHNKAIL